MFSEFIEKIINGDVQPGYRDPQEFMSGEERDEKSDSYSYGMMLFNEISGRDYFTVSGTEEDEYFMMADPDSDGSVIDSKYIPDEYRFLSDFFSKTTAFKRNERILPSEAAALLSEFNRIKCEPEGPFFQEEKADNAAETVSEVQDRYSVEEGYDYGIILNNKRSGRIEFRPLLFYTGDTEKYDMPVDKPGRFVIAVSKRHRDYCNVSNPSSVYGDVIIPVGLSAGEDVDSSSIRISIENQGGKLKVNFAELSGSRSETGKKYDVNWGA